MISLGFGIVEPFFPIYAVNAGATAFQSSAGGVSGAEGAVWVVFRGTADQVKKAMDLTRSIHGEPPYTE